MIITFETLVKNMAVIKQIRNIMAIYFCEIFETMLHIKIFLWIQRRSKTSFAAATQPVKWLNTETL